MAPVYCVLCGYLKSYGTESKPAQSWPGRHVTLMASFHDQPQGRCAGVPPQTPRMDWDSGDVTRETAGIP